jgi:hypothetical protein
VVTMKPVIENFKSPSLSGFFVTICYFLFLYFTSVLNRLTYIGSSEVTSLQ